MQNEQSLQLSQFAAFAAALWQCGSFAYYWSPNGPEHTDPASGKTYQEKVSLWFPPATPLAVPDLWLRHHNVYFGVHPARVKGGDHSRATVDTIEAVNCLFAEYDARTRPKAEYLLHMANLPARPSVVIDSGGGYHAYWLLAQTLPLSTEAERARLIEVQHAWNEAVGGEKGVNDLARVLRVPGSFNRKPERGPDFPMVKFVSCDLAHRHAFADLEAIAAPVMQRNQQKRATQRSAASPVDIDDAALLDLARAARGTGPLFSRLWDGDTAPYGNDHSKADQALINMLAFWTGKDTARMDRLFRSSGLMRDKWNRSDYRTRTLDLAVTTTANVYTPGQADPDAVLAAQSAIPGAPAVSTNGAGNPPPPPPTAQAQASGANAQPNLLHPDNADDRGNALAVLDLFPGEFLYVQEWGWLAYDGRCWNKAGAEARVYSAIQNAMIQRRIAAVQAQQEHIVRTTPCNRARIQGAEFVLQTMCAALTDWFDRSPDELNVANGVLNLRTGTLAPHDPAQHFTYCLPVPWNPLADYTEWVEFLAANVAGGPTVLAYLQQAVGYSLTGRTSEEVLFYVHGPTRSGKGTFTEAMLKLMGKPLAVEAKVSTFTAREQDSQGFDLAGLKPTRMVIASETERAERLSAGKIKLMTGGNHLRCSFKGKDHFEYQPQFKIWIASNHPVNVDPSDDAAWGRVRVIEFPNSYLGREDKTLKARMHTLENLEGVLRWAAEGAKAWYASPTGLNHPADVSTATQKHRDLLDHVQQWIDEDCRIDLSLQAYTGSGVAYQAYKNWCINNGIVPLGQTRLTEQLQQKGMKAERKWVGTKYQRVIAGLELI